MKKIEQNMGPHMVKKHSLNCETGILKVQLFLFCEQVYCSEEAIYLQDTAGVSAGGCCKMSTGTSTVVKVILSGPL